MSDVTDAERALIEQTDWPKREEDATADALILYGARLAAVISAESHELMVKAFAIDTDSPERKLALRAWTDAVVSMISAAQVVDLLAQVQQTSREQADALAARIWDLTEDGGVLMELMWDALATRGLDADAVFAMAERWASPTNQEIGDER